METEELQKQDPDTREALSRKLIPFLLAPCVVILDQISKWLITANIPLRSLGARFFGDLLRIIHVRNPGIAFSMGRDLSDAFRGVLFTLLPVIVIAILTVYYFRSREFTPLQRWAVAGVIGGGAGNLIDRIFRPDGVVDFIDVKFFGIFGLERWPTFNIADSAVVVCGLLLALSLFLQRKKT
ncbi:MAG: signal peptidase II [Spirochaetales bacterium]|nr:signal peptidase II [Spirochaetales bacterium]